MELVGSHLFAVMISSSFWSLRTVLGRTSNLASSVGVPSLEPSIEPFVRKVGVIKLKHILPGTRTVEQSCFGLFLVLTD